ncbi:hypothetical protein R1T08_05435 [Streptomyces sp. SBC-4]|nr:hypothetical protein [Streptomyces sp. SBC-4]MDV5143732.1 hypothetical protein [Streptomyces sp. SBC-4]
MTTNNFNAPISGQTIIGDHGVNQIVQQGAGPVDAVQLAGALVALLRAAGPEREAAELLRGELVRAGEDGRPVDGDQARGGWPPSVTAPRRAAGCSRWWRR